jgi:transcriptional regulator with XRE-family HTH domain
VSSFASGNHLRAARALAGLKQAELAKAAGLHVNSVRRLERSQERCGGWAGDRIKEALAIHGVEVLDSPAGVIKILKGRAHPKF